MEYKGYIIMATCKTYSEWSLNEDGSLGYKEHEFQGADVIEYKALTEYSELVIESCQSIDEIKKEIDELLEFNN